MNRLLVIVLGMGLLSGLLVETGCTTSTIEAQRSLYGQWVDGKSTRAEFATPTRD